MPRPGRAELEQRLAALLAEQRQLDVEEAAFAARLDAYNRWVDGMTAEELVEPSLRAACENEEIDLHAELRRISELRGQLEYDINHTRAKLTLVD